MSTTSEEVIIIEEDEEEDDSMMQSQHMDSNYNYIVPDKNAIVDHSRADLFSHA